MKRPIVLLLLAGTAHADVPRDAPTEIEVDRADAPAGRTEFGFDGGGPLPGGWGATIAAGWIERPFVATLADGTTTVPVRRRETVILGGALALGDSVAVDARWTFAHQIGDRLRGTGDEAELDRAVPGDFRIGARARVYNAPSIAVFLRADLGLATGDQGDFAGEAGTSLAWRLIGRARLPAGIVVAATAGLRLRGTEVLVADQIVGNEVLGGAGIAIPLPPVRPLWCVREQVKLTGEIVGVLGDDIGMGRGPSPAEMRFGIVTQPRPRWTFGMRVGSGLGDALGSPRFRGSIEISYGGSWTLIEPARSDEE